jgi:hypothetical protein
MCARFSWCIDFGFLVDTPFKLHIATVSFLRVVCIPCIHLLHVIVVRENNVCSAMSVGDRFGLL